MKQPTRCLIYLFAVILCTTSCTSKKEKPKTKPPVPVKVSQALQKDIPIQIKAIGNVEAFTSVAIKSQVNGQIARIHFAEGGDVSKGTLLVSIDPEPFQAELHQAEAALVKDQAQAKFAREQAQRYEGLLKEGIVTRDQYDLLRSNADSLAATLDADRAAIKNARIQLGYCSIRSPISGRTGTVAIQAGNLVKANDLSIVTVNQITPINITFSLPEKRLAEIKRCMAAGQLKIEAIIPNESGATESGTISFLDNAVNAATGMIKLKGVFANKSHKLWPGQFTDVLITLATRKNAIVIPIQAIQTGQQGEFIYVAGADNKVEIRPVISIAAGEEAVIEKGVAAGETVVVDGQLRLTSGAVVESGEKQSAGKSKKK
jgi:multidrug efflux system membrane fusion protein